MSFYFRPKLQLILLTGHICYQLLMRLQPLTPTTHGIYRSMAALVVSSDTKTVIFVKALLKQIVFL